MRIGQVRRYEESLMKDKVLATQPADRREDPIALKTCKIKLPNCEVELVEGAPISGLTRKEIRHLQKFKFVK